MLVADVMTHEVIAATEDDTVEHVQQLMTRGRFRHVPIIRPGLSQPPLSWPVRLQGIVVGVVSDRDIAVTLARSGDAGRQRPMREIMSAPPLTVLPDMPVEQAAALMADHQIGCLPVVAAVEPDSPRDGKLVGIVTESDLFRALIRLLGVQEPSTRVRLLLPEGHVDLLAQALQIIADRGVRLVGLVAEPVDSAGHWPITMRLRTIYPTPIIQQIQALGIQVESPTMPSATTETEAKEQ
jgi:acetoin utilization protein AcuB